MSYFTINILESGLKECVVTDTSLVEMFANGTEIESSNFERCSRDQAEMQVAEIIMMDQQSVSPIKNLKKRIKDDFR